MTGFGLVRVAAVQQTPVILDAEATIDKAIRLVEELASDGIDLVVFPECFVSLYPSGAWAAAAATWTDGCDELWERMWTSSVDLGGALMQRLTDACAAYGVHVAIGVNEREDARPGSLYNTLVVTGPDGVVLRHRKLMPTMHERVFHGVGAGQDLDVVDLPGVGRVGGLICWENRMPLARWAVYQGGPQIWLAPNADDSEGWIASMRHVAIEAGAFVVSVPQFIPAADAASHDLPMEDDRLARRQIALEDLPFVAEVWNDERVAPTVGGTRTEQELRERFATWRQDWHEHGFGMTIFRARATGTRIGWGGLQYSTIGIGSCLTVGYVVAPDEWGRGYATQIATTSVQTAFDELKVDTVYASVAASNTASRRVLEKSGLSAHREIDHDGLTEVIYVIDRRSKGLRRANGTYRVGRDRPIRRR